MSACKQMKFKVAAAHAAPVFMDKAATLKKVVRLIEQARVEDVKLLVFPETFVPGYPVSSTTGLPLLPLLPPATRKAPCQTPPGWLTTHRSTGSSVTLR
jgi:predicted amidohydrolase